MLFVHIGTQKTGTSALQLHLYKNRDALLQQGIRYLDAGRENGRRHSHGQLAQSILKGAHPNVWQDFRTELAASMSPTNVMSAEGFWFCDPEALRREISTLADTKIVVYLRRQDEYLQSLWKQAVTGGRKHDFQTWRERLPERGNYLSIIEKWAEHFGAENVIIRPYEKDASRGNTIQDFCRIIGAEKFSEATGARRNPSPRLELLHFIRAFNQLDLDVNRHEFFQALIGKSDSYIRTCDVLSPQEAATLMESYAEENRQLAEKFYKDKSRPLFHGIADVKAYDFLALESDAYFQITVDALQVLLEFALNGKMHRDSRGDDLPNQAPDRGADIKASRDSKKESRKLARKSARARSA